MTRNAFCKRIFGLYLSMRPLLGFPAFLCKPTFCSRAISSTVLTMTGLFIYLFYLLLIFSEKQSNISVKLLNFCRAAVGFDWICAFWGSAGLPEKEPWIKRHLLQRPGYQTTNKSDVTAADEVCMANCWWNELLVLKICKLIVSSHPGRSKRILTVLLTLFLLGPGTLTILTSSSKFYLKVWMAIFVHRCKCTPLKIKYLGFSRVRKGRDVNE